ncbi:MAG TPA: HNH endonuclease signature motif containing protein [Streptosporangiaceae bacterium]|nr:HNH endonuclease signature motif containing protein [Streptosporangiaceae bacterium]
MNRTGRLDQGCGRTRFASEIAAEKAVQRGAAGTPEECEQGGLLHWHLKVPATDTGPGRKTRLLVLKRDGRACVCCGVSVIGRPYSLQHRKRRSQGGGNSPSNLITVLGLGGELCHGRIDSRVSPRDEAMGYSVRSLDDPALIPVMLFSPHGSGMTVWLSDDGRYLYEEPGGRAA